MTLSGKGSFFRPSSALLYIVLFLVAFIPRVLALDAFVAPDEGKWIYRSAHFLEALLAGDLARMTSVAATPEVEVLAPAVPTMWTGALGLAARYWLDDSLPTAAGRLPDYLRTIPDQTEKIPLDLYPWTRFPTVLLTSLTIPLFYFLLARLLTWRAALLAALLLALDPFFIGLSRVIHHDALVAIFITISLLALLLFRQRFQARTWLILSGAAGGLALLTKPTALYLVVFAGLFLVVEASRRREDSTTSLSARLAAALIPVVIWGGVAFVTFLALWPALWSAPVGTLAALSDRAASAVSDNNNYSLMPAPDSPLPELGFLYYPVNWLFKATLPGLVGVIALVVAWWRGWLRDSGQETFSLSSGKDSITWTVTWLAVFALLFLGLLIPADTRDIRYFLPAIPALYGLAAVGIVALAGRFEQRRPPVPGRRPKSAGTGPVFWGVIGLLLVIQAGLAIVYYPYFVDYWNPVAGGPWLAPRLVKVGSGEGLDRMGRYLSQKPEATRLTVATSFWESFVPFFPGHYTKAHYDDEADYIVIYIRQIQNQNPYPEYWTYFSARPPEHKVSLLGLDYAWLYPGPQLRVVRDALFRDGLVLQGYRLDRWAAQPGQAADLTLVWAGAGPAPADQEVVVQLTGAGDHVWAESRGPVLSPAGPSPVEGHYRLDLPADLPRGDYDLRVSVGAIRHRAGAVPVRRLEKPVAQIPASTIFGDLILFGGANLGQAIARPGEPVDVTLFWQARQPIRQSFTTFVHAVDESGQIWGQVDRLPGDGRWPTDSWDQGEWLVDQFQLSLKPDTPAGDYTLLVGLYDAQSLARLPVVGQDEGQTVVELTTLTVPAE